MIRVSSILKRQDAEANLSDPFTGKRPSTGEGPGESGVKLLPAANLPLGSLNFHGSPFHTSPTHVDALSREWVFVCI